MVIGGNSDNFYAYNWAEGKSTGRGYSGKAPAPLPLVSRHYVPFPKVIQIGENPGSTLCFVSEPLNFLR